jgi:hypothetical protein
MSEDPSTPTTPNHFAGPHLASDTDGALPAVATLEGGTGADDEVGFPSRSPETAIDEVDQLLDSVEEALAALDDGTYGVCRTCGSAVEPSRLAGDPLVRVCGSCGSGTTISLG